MTHHTVAQGECFVSLADKYGFTDPQVLYEHPENAEIKRQRPCLGALLPGDRVFIPEPEAKEIECASGRVHRFRARRARAAVRVFLKDHAGLAHAGKRFRIEAGEAPIEGTTDASGLAEGTVLPDATEARLSLWLRDGEEAPTITWTLQIGHLDPVDSLSGAQARLRNLGRYHGAVDGTLDAATKIALAAFQREHELPVTSCLDEATQSALARAHAGT